MYFPRKIEYWMCSDGRTFPTEEQAKEYESFLERQSKDPSSFANSYQSSKPDIFDVTF